MRNLPYSGGIHAQIPNRSIKLLTAGEISAQISDERVQLPGAEGSHAQISERNRQLLTAGGSSAQISKESLQVTRAGQSISERAIRMQKLLGIADDAMESVWGKTPQGFQRTVLPVLLDMGCSGGKPGCVLMV